MTRRERLERKMERRQEWSGKAASRSGSRFNAASAIADNIPLGQPILVGHHSERHARKDAERIHSNMSKGCEEARLSEHHASAAAGIAQQLDRSIFSDDENAIAALEARAAKHDQRSNGINGINKAWRKTSGTPAERCAALVATELVSPALAATVAQTMALCPWLKTPLDATGDRAAARRDRDRIAEIKKRMACTERAESAPGGVLITGDDQWCNVTFAEKPDREVLTALKAAGYRWSGGSWCGYTDKLPDCVREMRGAA